MWIEVALVVLVIIQMVLLIFMAWQLHRVRCAMADQEKAGGGVPALLTISALNKIDHRLDSLEARFQQIIQQRRPLVDAAPPPVAAMPTAHTVPITSDYELAQQLAREGCDLDTLMKRCKLSRNEAELIVRLYARQG